MRRKMLNKAKLIIEVESYKNDKKIYTISVYDNRSNKYVPELIKERGIEWFLNVNDMKETLNWNLNGDDKKYQFKWTKNIKGKSTGYAYIFD